MNRCIIAPLTYPRPVHQLALTLRTVRGSGVRRALTTSASLKHVLPSNDSSSAGQTQEPLYASKSHDHTGQALSDGHLFSTFPSATPTTFHVVGPGSGGAMLMVRLAPSASICAHPQSIVGYSSTLSLQSSSSSALPITMAGFFRQLSVPPIPVTEGGEALFAPPSDLSADIATLELNEDDSTGYYIRSGQLLAYHDASLNLSMVGNPFWAWKPTGSMVAYHAQGRGSLAITGHGSLYKVILKSDEVYHINPRYLVAWSGLLRIQGPEWTTVAPSGRSHSESSRLSKMIALITDRMGSWVQFWRKLNYCTLQGPGDFYMESRIRRPLLTWTRSAQSPSSPSPPPRTS